MHTPTKVLIVEDNELSLRLLLEILEYEGYEVLSTELGEAAIELVRQHRPDLILMDIQLPGISGMETAQRLKGDAQTRTIPIIAITAFAMSGDEKKILAHLEKIVSSLQFQSKSVSVLDGPIPGEISRRRP